MKKILMITTGGTFSKVYNPLNGKLEISENGDIVEEIAKKWQCELEILPIIAKDSLEMTNHDRLELLGTITQSSFQHIIVIHGTDTMDVTAAYLAESEIDKTIILTGAMVPYSIDPVEATANLASAYGYLHSVEKEGIYIAMHGLIAPYDHIKKNRQKGRFILS